MLEVELDDLMRPVGLDVEFTRHFAERLLGREKAVTIDEIKTAFAKLKKKYKKRLLAAKRDPESSRALLRDLSADLNIVFAIQGDELTNITIMRKANFGNTDYGSKEFRV